jgi:hypothetical protein
MGRFLAWECICECGAVKAYRQSHLLDGVSRSCGCLSRETTSNIKRTHGQSQSPEYNIWTLMRDRCGNPLSGSYKDYGGRGIKVCERWASFQAFINDMGPRPSLRHSIDRIDNDGPYAPGNCRWATQSVQARNTRKAVIVSLDGVTKPLKDWSDELGLSYGSMHQALRRGDDIAEWIKRQKKPAKAAA